MVDATLETTAITRPARPSALRRAMQRKSTIAFLMALPLILLVALLVIYPAFYSIHLATLNKSMERFVGFGNFTFLFKRETFWLVVLPVLLLLEIVCVPPATCTGAPIVLMVFSVIVEVPPFT